MPLSITGRGGVSAVIPDELLAARDPEAIKVFLQQRGISEVQDVGFADQDAIRAMADEQSARAAEVAGALDPNAIAQETTRQVTNAMPAVPFMTAEPGKGIADALGYYADQLQPGGMPRKAVETLADIARILTPDYREALITGAKGAAGTVENVFSAMQPGAAVMAMPAAGFDWQKANEIAATPRKYLQDQWGQVAYPGPQAMPQSWDTAMAEEDPTARAINAGYLATRGAVENLPQTAAQIAASAALGPAGWVLPTALMEFGDNLSTANDEGRHGLQPTAAAAGGAAANTAIEALTITPLIRALGLGKVVTGAVEKAAPNLGRTILASLGHQALEIPQEMVQEGVNVGTNILGGGSAPTREQFLDQIKTAGLMAAGSGGAQTIIGGLGEHVGNLRTADAEAAAAAAKSAAESAALARANADQARIDKAIDVEATTVADAPAVDPASAVGVPGGPANVPTPDSLEVVREQMAFALDPKAERAAVLFTPGTPLPYDENGNVPVGFESTLAGKHGVVWFNPNKTTKARIQNAGKGEVFDPRGLFGKGAKIPNGPTRIVVTARTSNAEAPVATLLVNPDSESIAAGVKTVKKSHPGAIVTVETVANVEADRRRAAQKAGGAPAAASLDQYRAKIEAAKTAGVITQSGGSWWGQASGSRPMVFVNIGGKKMPFYRSAGVGGGGKVRGTWHPFFGFGRGGWLIKGTSKQIANSYGRKDIAAAQKWLNENFNWDRDLDGDIFYNSDSSPLSLLGPKGKGGIAEIFGVDKNENVANDGKGSSDKHINDFLASLGADSGTPISVKGGETQDGQRNLQGQTQEQGQDAPVGEKGEVAQAASTPAAPTTTAAAAPATPVPAAASTPVPAKKAKKAKKEIVNVAAETPAAAAPAAEAPAAEAPAAEAPVAAPAPTPAAEAPAAAPAAAAPAAAATPAPPPAAPATPAAEPAAKPKKGRRREIVNVPALSEPAPKQDVSLTTAPPIERSGKGLKDDVITGWAASERVRLGKAGLTDEKTPAGKQTDEILNVTLGDHSGFMSVAGMAARGEPISPTSLEVKHGESVITLNPPPGYALKSDGFYYLDSTDPELVTDPTIVRKGTPTPEDRDLDWTRDLGFEPLESLLLSPAHAKPVTKVSKEEIVKGLQKASDSITAEVEKSAAKAAETREDYEAAKAAYKDASEAIDLLVPKEADIYTSKSEDEDKTIGSTYRLGTDAELVLEASPKSHSLAEVTSSIADLEQIISMVDTGSSPFAREAIPLQMDMPLVANFELIHKTGQGAVIQVVLGEATDSAARELIGKDMTDEQWAEVRDHEKLNAIVDRAEALKIGTPGDTVTVQEEIPGESAVAARERANQLRAPGLMTIGVGRIRRAFAGAGTWGAFIAHRNALIDHALALRLMVQVNEQLGIIQKTGAPQGLDITLPPANASRKDMEAALAKVEKWIENVHRREVSKEMEDAGIRIESMTREQIRKSGVPASARTADIYLRGIRNELHRRIALMDSMALLENKAFLDWAKMERLLSFTPAGEIARESEQAIKRYNNLLELMVRTHMLQWDDPESARRAKDHPTVMPSKAEMEQYADAVRDGKAEKLTKEQVLWGRHRLITRPWDGVDRVAKEIYARRRQVMDELETETDPAKTKALRAELAALQERYRKEVISARANIKGERKLVKAEKEANRIRWELAKARDKAEANAAKAKENADKAKANGVENADAEKDKAQAATDNARITGLEVALGAAEGKVVTANREYRAGRIAYTFDVTAQEPYTDDDKPDPFSNVDPVERLDSIEKDLGLTGYSAVGAYDPSARNRAILAKLPPAERIQAHYYRAATIAAFRDGASVSQRSIKDLEKEIKRRKKENEEDKDEVAKMEIQDLIDRVESLKRQRDGVEAPDTKGDRDKLKEKIEKLNEGLKKKRKSQKSITEDKALLQQYTRELSALEEKAPADVLNMKLGRTGMRRYARGVTREIIQDLPGTMESRMNTLNAAIQGMVAGDKALGSDRRRYGFRSIRQVTNASDLLSVIGGVIIKSQAWMQPALRKIAFDIMVDGAMESYAHRLATRDEDSKRPEPQAPVISVRVADGGITIRDLADAIGGRAGSTLTDTDKARADREQMLSLFTSGISSGVARDIDSTATQKYVMLKSPDFDQIAVVPVTFAARKGIGRMVSFMAPLSGRFQSPKGWGKFRTGENTRLDVIAKSPTLAKMRVIGIFNMAPETALIQAEPIILGGQEGMSYLVDSISEADAVRQSVEGMAVGHDALVRRKSDLEIAPDDTTEETDKKTSSIIERFTEEANVDVNAVQTLLFNMSQKGARRVAAEDVSKLILAFAQELYVHDLDVDSFLQDSFGNGVRLNLMGSLADLYDAMVNYGGGGVQARKLAGGTDPMEAFMLSFIQVLREAANEIKAGTTGETAIPSTANRQGAAQGKAGVRAVDQVDQLSIAEAIARKYGLAGKRGGILRELRSGARETVELKESEVGSKPLIKVTDKQRKAILDAIQERQVTEHVTWSPSRAKDEQALHENAFYDALKEADSELKWVNVDGGRAAVLNAKQGVILGEMFRESTATRPLIPAWWTVSVANNDQVMITDYGMGAANRATKTYTNVPMVVMTEGVLGAIQRYSRNLRSIRAAAGEVEFDIKLAERRARLIAARERAKAKSASEWSEAVRRAREVAPAEVTERPVLPEIDPKAEKKKQDELDERGKAWLADAPARKIPFQPTTPLEETTGEVAPTGPIEDPGIVAKPRVGGMSYESDVLFRRWREKYNSDPELRARVKFSRLEDGDVAGSGMSVDEVNEALKEILGVDTVPANIIVTGDPDQSMVASLSDGKIYIVAGNVMDADDLEASLRHEGMHGVIASRDARALEAFDAVLKAADPETVRRVREAYAKDLPDDVAEEIALTAAEEIASKAPANLIERVMRAIEDAAYKLPGVGSIMRRFRMPSVGSQARYLVSRGIAEVARISSAKTEGEQRPPFGKQKFYHATTRERAERLRRDGFAGEVPFDRTSKDYQEALYGGERGRKLFLYDNREDAEFYAKRFGADAEIVEMDLDPSAVEVDNEALGRAFMTGAVRPADIARPAPKFSRLGRRGFKNADRVAATLETVAPGSSTAPAVATMGPETAAKREAVLLDAAAQQHLVPEERSATLRRWQAISAADLDAAPSAGARVDLMAQRRAARGLSAVLNLSSLLREEFGIVDGELRNLAERMNALPENDVEGRAALLAQLKTAGEGVIAWHRFLQSELTKRNEKVAEDEKALRAAEEEYQGNIDSGRAEDAAAEVQSIREDLHEWLDTEPRSQIQLLATAESRERQATSLALERMFDTPGINDDLAAAMNRLSTDPRYEADVSRILASDATPAAMRDAILDGPFTRMLADDPSIEASDGMTILLAPNPQFGGVAPIRRFTSLPSVLSVIRGVRAQRRAAEEMVERLVADRPNLSAGPDLANVNRLVNMLAAASRDHGAIRSANRLANRRMRRARVALRSTAYQVEFLRDLLSDEQYLDQVMTAADHGEHRYPNLIAESGSGRADSDEIVVTMPPNESGNSERRVFRWGNTIAADNAMRSQIAGAAQEILEWTANPPAGTDPILVRTYRTHVLQRIADILGPHWMLEGNKTAGSWLSGIYVGLKAKSSVLAGLASFLEPIARDIGGQWSRRMRADLDRFNRIHAVSRQLTDEWPKIVRGSWAAVAAQEEARMGLKPGKFSYRDGEGYRKFVTNQIAWANQSGRERGVVAGSRLYDAESGREHIVTAADMRFAKDLKRWSDRLRQMAESDGGRAITFSESTSPIRPEISEAEEDKSIAIPSDRLSISPGEFTSARWPMMREVNRLWRKWLDLVPRGTTATRGEDKRDYKAAADAHWNAFFATDPATGQSKDQEVFSQLMLGHVMEDNPENRVRSRSKYAPVYNRILQAIRERDGFSPRNAEELIARLATAAANIIHQPAGAEPIDFVKDIRATLMSELETTMENMVSRYADTNRTDVEVVANRDQFNTARGELVGPGGLYDHLPSSEQDVASVISQIARNAATKLKNTIAEVRSNLKHTINEEEARIEGGKPQQFTAEERAAGRVFHTLDELRNYEQGFGHMESYLDQHIRANPAKMASLGRLVGSSINLAMALALSPLTSGVAVFRDLVSTSTFHTPQMMYGLGASFRSVLFSSVANGAKVLADLTRMVADTKLGRRLGKLVPFLTDMANTHRQMHDEQLAMAMADQRMGAEVLKEKALESLSSDVTDAENAASTRLGKFVAGRVARTNRALQRWSRKTMSSRAYIEDILVKSVAASTESLMRNYRRNYRRAVLAGQITPGQPVTPEVLFGNGRWFSRDKVATLNNVRELLASAEGGLDGALARWFEATRGMAEDQALEQRFDQPSQDAMLRTAVGLSTRPWASTMPMARIAGGMAGEVGKWGTALKGQPSASKTTRARFLGKSSKDSVIGRNFQVTMALSASLLAVLLGIMFSGELPDELRAAISGQGRTTVGIAEVLNNPELLGRYVGQLASSADIIPDMVAYSLGVGNHQYNPLDLSSHMFGLSVMEDAVKSVATGFARGPVAGAEHLLRRRIPMLNYALSRIHGEGDASRLYRAYRRVGEEGDLREMPGGGGLMDVQSAESAVAREAANAVVAGDARKAAEKKNQLIRLIRQKGGGLFEANRRAETRIQSQLPIRRAFAAPPDRGVISVLDRRLSRDERELMRRERRLISVM